MDLACSGRTARRIIRANMLNWYYIYGVLWSTVLFLYELGWSGLNKPLNPILLVFFLSTISLSFVLGARCRGTGKADFSHLPNLPCFFLPVVIVCAAFSFLQQGSIPLLRFVDASYDYNELLDADSSLFKTVAMVSSVFGCVYQFAYFSGHRKRRDLWQSFVYAFILLFYSSRSPLMICLFCILVIMVTSKKGMWSVKSVLTIALLVVAALWLFGVYGNIRSGYDWNDSSYIYLLGYFEGYWPDILPKEFCWAYSYITSPLANLNYALSFSVQPDVVNFFYDFLPMLIAKRMPLYITPRPPLQVPYFNVSSIWSNYVFHIGALGLFFGYLGQLIMLKISELAGKGTPYQSLVMLFCTECVAFSFFVNSFAYPTMGYPLLMLVMIALWKKLTGGRRARGIMSMEGVSDV